MATYSIRMDDRLKTQFDALCANIGLSASTAFNIFAKKAVSRRALPVELSENISREDAEVLRAMSDLRKENALSNQPELSLDEINSEIGSYRQAREGAK